MSVARPVTAPDPARPAHRVRDPRDVRVAALVMGASAGGDLAAQSALTLRLHAESGSGTVVSALLLANTVPVLLSLPVAGRLADRVDSRRLLVGCGLGCAALCACLAAARPTWLVLALVAALAAISSVVNAAVGALLPVLAGPGGVVRANTAIRGAVMVLSVAGLAAGGAGSQWLGTGPVLLLDAATFLGVAAGAWVIRGRRAGAAEGSRRGGPGPGAAPSAVRWTVAGGYAGVLLAVSTTNVAQVFLVKDALGADDLAYGLVSACWAAGTLLALPLVRHVRPDPDLLARLTIIGGVTTASAIVACGAVATLTATAALYVLGGAATCVMQVARGSYLQLTAAPEHRGRQLAAYNAVTKAAVIGALALGGPLVELVGGPATYVLAGTAATAVAGLSALAWTRLGGPGNDRAPGGPGSHRAAAGEVR